jgi:hypothetical protein
VAGVGEFEQGQQLGHPPVRFGTAEAAQSRHHAQVLGTGLQVVDRGVLPGHADRPPDPVPVGHHVVPGHGGGAGVGAHQCGQDADHRRLAGPVRAQQGEHAAALDPQVDAVEHPHPAVRLHQSGRADRQVIRHAFPSCLRTLYQYAVHVRRCLTYKQITLVHFEPY